MNNYLITYNDSKTVTVTATDADHARLAIKKVISNITHINSILKIPKYAIKNKIKERKTLP